MVDILVEDTGDGKGYGQTQAVKSIDILRYQNPLRGMSSALHAAIENHNQVTAGLLLWLASNLDTSVFQEDVVRQAQERGVLRGQMSSGTDIQKLAIRRGQNRCAACGDDQWRLGSMGGCEMVRAVDRESHRTVMWV